MKFEQPANKEVQDRSAEDIMKDIKELEEYIKNIEEQISAFGESTSEDNKLLTEKGEELEKLKKELRDLNVDTNENEPVKVTKEQLNLLQYGQVNGPQVIDLMDSLGLEMNNGLVEIKVDGEVKKMNTSEHDLGTLLVE